MATITVTKGYNDPTGFTSGETVTPAKLNSAQSPAVSISAIVNADIDASAAIEGSKLADNSVTASKLASGAAIPAGAVMPFARSTAPSGWLIANGDAVPNGSGTVQGVTADFSALYAAVSTEFGTAGTLPDLRGIFVRGSGSQTISGITYNKTFAAKEGDAFQGHFHNVEIINTATLVGLQASSGGAGAVGAAVPVGTTSGDANDNLIRAETIVSDGTNGTPRTESETRPANIALLYCIKF